MKVVFEEITEEALNRGETVKLPFGKFEVKKHNRPPLRGWFLNPSESPIGSGVSTSSSPLGKGCLEG